MAQAILQDLVGKEQLAANVKSAGIYAREGSFASDNAVQAMQRMGLDLTSHKSTLLSASLVNWADLILTMTQGQKNDLIRVFPDATEKTDTVSAYLQGTIADVHDPFGGNLDVYLRCAQYLQDLFYHNIEKI